MWQPNCSSSLPCSGSSGPQATLKQEMQLSLIGKAPLTPGVGGSSPLVAIEICKTRLSV